MKTSTHFYKCRKRVTVSADNYTCPRGWLVRNTCLVLGKKTQWRSCIGIYRQSFRIRRFAHFWRKYYRIVFSMLFLAGLECKYLHPLELCGVGVFAQCARWQCSRDVYLGQSSVGHLLVKHINKHRNHKHGQGEGHHQLFSCCHCFSCNKSTIEPVFICQFIVRYLSWTVTFSYN